MKKEVRDLKMTNTEDRQRRSNIQIRGILRNTKVREQKA